MREALIQNKKLKKNGKVIYIFLLCFLLEVLEFCILYLGM